MILDPERGRGCGWRVPRTSSDGLNVKLGSIGDEGHQEQVVVDGAEALDRSMEWSVFIQRAMNPAFIIVGGELDEDPTQVGLPEHDQVVDALPPDGANQSFRKTVLPCERPR